MGLIFSILMLGLIASLSPATIVAFACFTLASPDSVGLMYFCYSRRPGESKAFLAELRYRAIASGPAVRRRGNGGRSLPRDRRPPRSDGVVRLPSRSWFGNAYAPARRG
jgi:hypothetical protein